MQVVTLKRAAGRFTFGPDETLDMPDAQARELIDCGAVTPVAKPEPPEKVKRPKRTASVSEGE